ncbi:hypothetical protein [Caldimonas brevitalea]|uniref:Uncharacterized protein n=1 Tax=Caldimonas brevitalea TaxID=413882 RepID=A0A0G3BDW9_9BURK|nr:hypothetical protein [Caldimonas brevitalea]AKJ27487.1 hypothetical protein AAW51_0796 [Caldimonas brevitalea]
MQASKIDWIRRCAERFLDQHPALETDQAIHLAAALWTDAEMWGSPEEAAEIEMAVWEDEASGTMQPLYQQATRH